MGKRGNIAINGKRTSGKAISEFVTILTPSSDMSKRAVTVWQQIIGAYPAGHFAEGDRFLLKQFCEAIAQHRRATALLKRVGRYYTDKAGVVRKHPATDDQSKAWCECAMLAG